MNTNPFRGINPHLNSLLQTPGNEDRSSLWPTFHSTHINHIADFMNQQLPPDYTAYTEQSLQVRGVEWGPDIILTRPRPDVTIFRQGADKGSTPTPTVASPPTWEAPLAAVIEPLKRPVAVVIRKRDYDVALGRVVARIELLSASNKPGASDASAYEDRRIESIESEIPLIEIDYLHEARPVIGDIPDYPTDPAAYPYMVVVSNPRPSWDEGKVAAYGFRVDEPVATIPLPLATGEELAFDFDRVYQYTFQSRRYYNLLDYTHPPARFYTYSIEDQAKILERMNELV